MWRCGSVVVSTPDFRSEDRKIDVKKLWCLSRYRRHIREFKQIATAGAATAIVVKEVWGEYFAVARQNSTLSNAKYK